MYANETIQRAIKAACKPQQCVAEIWDYGQKLRFRVFDPNDRPILRMDSLVLSTVRSQTHLSQLVGEVRERIARRGLPLVPWSPPAET